MKTAASSAATTAPTSAASTAASSVPRPGGMLPLFAAPGENVGEAQRVQRSKQRVSANPGAGLGGAGQAAEEASLLTRLAQGVGLRSQAAPRVNGRTACRLPGHERDVFRADPALRRHDGESRVTGRTYQHAFRMMLEIILNTKVTSTRRRY